jgi:hypothetical protein
MLIMGTVGGSAIFSVHTESMQCKKLPVEFEKIRRVFVPFASVYTAGNI